MKQSQHYSAAINKVGIISILTNIFLTAIKLTLGFLGSSSALISDAAHSLSDVFTTIIVIIGAKISVKDSDKKHPYGHERFESVASVFLGILLAVTAIGIGYKGIKSIINFINSNYTPSKYTILALIATIISILLKGIMYVYTIRVANKIKSTSLKADALHHLSDSLSSIASMLGIIGLMIGKGFEIMDPIATIFICLIIFRLSFKIIKGAFDQLVDTSIGDTLINEIKSEIELEKGVIQIKSFQSRKFGNKIYIDVEIYVKSDISLIEANNISETLHSKFEHKYSDIKHCSICPKPFNEDSQLR